LAVFIWDHDRLALDLMLHGILDMFGYIFIFRIIVCHKQHVLAFLVTTRKLLTSIFNILVFKHRILPGQVLALGIVMVAILMELYIKYRSNQQKFKSITDTEDPPAISTI
jgi:hypothetical protein